MFWIWFSGKHEWWNRKAPFTTPASEVMSCYMLSFIATHYLQPNHNYALKQPLLPKAVNIRVCFGGIYTASTKCTKWVISILSPRQRPARAPHSDAYDCLTPGVVTFAVSRQKSQQSWYNRPVTDGVALATCPEPAGSYVKATRNAICVWT